MATNITGSASSERRHVVDKGDDRPGGEPGAASYRHTDVTSRRRLVTTVVGSLVAIVVAVIGAVTASTPSAHAESKVTLRIAFLQKPDSLNPFTGIAAES